MTALVLLLIRLSRHTRWDESNESTMFAFWLIYLTEFCVSWWYFTASRGAVQFVNCDHRETDLAVRRAPWLIGSVRIGRGLDAASKLRVVAAKSRSILTRERTIIVATS